MLSCTCHLPGWMWWRKSCWPWHAGCPPRPPPSPPWESLSQPDLDYHPVEKLYISQTLSSDYQCEKEEAKFDIWQYWPVWYLQTNIGRCDICRQILATVIFASKILATVIFASKYWPIWYLQTKYWPVWYFQANQCKNEGLLLLHPPAIIFSQVEWLKYSLK